MKTILNDTDRAAVIGRLRSLAPDDTRRWGRMTPHGALCHLTDSFAACLGDRESLDVSNLFSRTAMRFVAISVPLRWPHGVKTLPSVDQEKQGTPPEDFGRDRTRCVEITEAFVARLDPDTMRHPIFARMSAAEWGRWGYRHLDHHLRQFGR